MNTQDAVLSLPTVQDVRKHVHDVLCRHDNLDPEQTPLWQAVLVRSGRPCGLEFVVQGPRRVTTSAVWAGEEGRILFYDSQGFRFAQTQVSDGPDPRQLVAR